MRSSTFRILMRTTEVRRVLKPGGWLLLQTPNKWTNSIFETIRWRSFSKWRVDHCSLHNYWQPPAGCRRSGRRRIRGCQGRHALTAKAAAIWALACCC